MTKTLSRTLALALMLSIAAPAFAQTSVQVTGSAAAGAGSATAGAHASAGVSTDKVTQAKARADQEIDRRIAGLNAFLTRIQAMQKVDATFKATLSTTIQGQIADLTNLKATIDADTNTSTLKVEVQSIAKSYRIYMLVMPQAALGAAADRAQTLVTMFTTLGAKLQARIASSTTDTSAAVTAMADFNAKVADGQVQATAAVGHIAGLTPDNGDKTVMQSNLTALKQARADIKVATQDFVAARKDAQTIMQALGASSASASSTTTVQTQ